MLLNFRNKLFFSEGFVPVLLLSSLVLNNLLNLNCNKYTLLNSLSVSKLRPNDTEEFLSELLQHLHVYNCEKCLLCERAPLFIFSNCINKTFFNFASRNSVLEACNIKIIIYSFLLTKYRKSKIIKYKTIFVSVK